MITQIKVSGICFVSLLCLIGSMTFRGFPVVAKKPQSHERQAWAAMRANVAALMVRLRQRYSERDLKRIYWLSGQMYVRANAEAKRMAPDAPEGAPFDLDAVSATLEKQLCIARSVETQMSAQIRKRYKLTEAEFNAIRTHGGYANWPTPDKPHPKRN